MAIMFIIIIITILIIIIIVIIIVANRSIDVSKSRNNRPVNLPLSQKIRVSWRHFKSISFDGLTYNTRGYFASCKTAGKLQSVVFKILKVVTFKTKSSKNNIYREKECPLIGEVPLSVLIYHP